MKKCICTKIKKLIEEHIGRPLLGMELHEEDGKIEITYAVCNEYFDQLNDCYKKE